MRPPQHPCHRRQRVVPDGPRRRHPPVAYSVDGLTSFSVAAAERASGPADRPSKLEGAAAWIDYAAPPGTVPHVSFSRSCAATSPRLLPRQGRCRRPDRAVAPGCACRLVLRAASDGGAEVQANAIWTAMHGFPLQQPAWLAATPSASCCSRSSRRWLPLARHRSAASLVAVVVGALSSRLAQLAFDHGWVMLSFTRCLALVSRRSAAIAFGALLTSVRAGADPRPLRPLRP